MRVTTTTDRVDLDGDYGLVEGVEVTCSRCGHSEECLGTAEASILRCLSQLRANCPKREKNYYVMDD